MRAVARCFVTRALPGSALERLAAAHDVEVWPQRTPPPAAALREAASSADALLTLLTDPVDAALLAPRASPSLRAVANYAVGTDNVDLPAASARGIPVGHTPDVLTETTADLAWALLMAGARRLGEAERAVRAGDWPTWEPGAYLGTDVHGATLGIVGYGRIGQALARRAGGFGMTVLHTRAAPLDEVLRRSDFVSLHTPLTEATRRMIGARELALMRRHAVLINTARGEIVDTDALVDALESGSVGGAALDVTDPEPLPAGRPRAAVRAPSAGGAAHRLGVGAHARRDGRHGGRQPAVRARGEAMPHVANPEIYER